MRAAIYVNEVDGLNRRDIDDQINQLKELASQQRWKIKQIYREKPANGKITDGSKKALNQLLEDGHKRHYDVVLFWALNQLSRKGALQTLSLLAKLHESGVGYRSFTEQYLDSTGTNKEALTSVISSIVDQERTNISERTRNGLARQRMNGKPGPKGHLGPGQPPADFDVKKATTLRKQGKSYQQIAVACGVSKATIYRYLNARKVAVA